MRVLTLRKASMVCALLMLLLIVVGLASLTLGSVKIGVSRALSVVFDALIGGAAQGTETERTIILDLRVPRALLAALVGAGLSVSGAVFQAFLRNPLADPYILGVSSGAAVGAIVAIFMGVGTLSFGLPLASFCGGLLTIFIVFYFGRQEGKIHPHTLLLAGVVVSSFFSAIIMFFLSISHREELRSIVFWLMGDFSVSNYDASRLIFPYLLFAFLLIYSRAREYNLILFGEESALQLGVDVERLKLVSYLGASLITAASVSMCGLIGFVGLIVPHSVRLLFGADHRLLLPASALLGASFLVASDALGRTLFAPVELPVGVITATFGGPFFVYLLRRRKAVRTL